MTDANRASSTTHQTAWPEDYREYVFQHGQLLGDFDNMYRHAKGVPWNQDQRCEEWSAATGLLMVRTHAPYGTALEIGCGLGYITAKLKPLVRDRLEAFDLSPEAIRKAQALHPGIEFYVDDITRLDFQPRRAYDLVVVKDVFWYVFPSLETVLRNLRACLRPRGFLYLAQFFPALDRPFVGKEMLPTPDALAACFSEYTPLYTALLHHHQRPDDGPTFHFLGAKHE